MKVYKVSLVFKTPNENGRLLDFMSKKDDIIYALKAFNNRYIGNRVLKLCAISKQSIVLLLGINIQNDVKATARDLSYFSKRLHHDKGWKLYSREATKLFTASEFNEITETFEETFDQIDEIDYKIINLSSESKNQPISIDENINISDEEALKAFEGLLNIQGIGDTNSITRRKELIKQIKKLIFDALT